MRKSLGFAVLGTLGMASLALAGTSTFLFSTKYLPHRYCYLAQPGLVWSNVSTDALIGVSYVLIFACLVLIAHQLRSIAEIRAYLWVFISFGVFIVACASTHFMEVVTIWWPIYRLAVALKILCAAASVGTAWLLSREVRRIITGIKEFMHLLESRRLENIAGKIEIDQGEARIRDTEARLQAILDNVLDSIIVIDATGIIVSANPATAKMFEYEEGELVGKNIKLLMPEPNRSRHDGYLGNYKSTGASKAIGVGRELEGLAKTGRLFAMELTITEIFHQQQQMFVGLIRDVTERRHTENELKNQAALLELAHDAIMVRDMQGLAIFWNRGANDLYGWTAEEVNGHTTHDLLQTQFPIPLASLLTIVHNDGAWEGELRQKTRHGQEIVVASRWSLQRDEQQAPKSILLINRDITERKRGDELRERLAAVVDSSDDAIITKDLDSVISAWNRGAEKVFGYAASEVLGKSMLMLMLPDHTDEESDILAHIKKGDSIEHFETVRVRKGGSTIDVSLTISPMQDSTGKISGASEIARDISERKRAEEALMEKEHLLSESQRIAHVGSWIYHLDNPGNKIVWSEETYRLYGVSPDSFEPTVESLLQLVLPEDRPIMQTWIAACMAGEKPADFEFRSSLPDGTVRHLSGRGELQRAPRDGPARMVGTVQDITESRKAETALRDSEDRFLAMANGIPQLAWMAEADGSIIWYNQRWFEFTGTTLEQMQGWGWQGVHDPDFLPLVLERWKKSIATGRPFEMEFPLRRADGIFCTFLTRVMPLQNSQGSVIRWFGTNTDISERKHAEEQLATQATQLSLSRQDLESQTLMLESVLSSMVEGLIAADEQGKFILWNPAAEKIIGRGKDDISPADWSAYYGAYLPDKVTPFPTELHPLLRAIRGEANATEIVFRNSGLAHEVWVETNAAPLKDKQGVLRGGVVAFRDVTQRKADEQEIRKLNEELEERIAKRTAQLQAANHHLQTANQDLESFSYSVSHDLRTPLRHIAGFSRILMNDFASSMEVEAREYLARIEHAVACMGLLVDALLSLAKLGRRPLQSRSAELNPIVDEVIALLKPEYEGRDVEWRVARLPALECDPILIGQVFQNLLGNALKYSRRRNKAIIEVGCIQSPGEPSTIFVRDNGAGFNMEYAQRLFGVFQRMHTESEFEGTGVGLATVQRIVQKHGGSIWAEAEEDRGATFYFALQAPKVQELSIETETLLR